MASSLIVGALLGAVAGEVLKAILDAKHKACKFRSLLEQLQSTLESITPKIEEIKKLDSERFDRRRPEFDKLTAELEKAKELVRKCETVPAWNLWQVYRHSKKLLKLDNFLVRFFQFEASAGMWCDVKQISVDVQELQQLNRGSRSDDRSGLEAWRAVPQLPSVTVGLEVPLRELKSELFRDAVKVVGLCAPGGCGKTTLAAKLCQDKEVRDRFKENIFFLTVSSSPNLKVILRGLVEQIGRGSQFCELQNDEDGVKRLGYILRQKEPEEILLVLDDVWSETFLKKFVFGTVGYKILVTSRTAFQTFDSTYSLKMLSDSDAMTLFRHSAFPEDGDYERPDEDLVKKIVTGCRGLPLALKVIGHSLCRQPARRWRRTARILWKGGSIFDTHKDLLDSLATSIDFLEDGVRECFLDLGSFSEDQRIPASAIIDLWVELYDLEEDDAYVNLLELSDHYLIHLVESRRSAGEIDSNFNELFVIQHDLLRDLAIYMNEEDQNIRRRKRVAVDERRDIHRRWVGEDYQTFDARLVSIYTGEAFPLRERPMQFPEAEALVLNVSAKCCTLPRFTETMAMLKVLIVSNNGPELVELNKLSAISHLPHLKRIRLEKVVVPSLNGIIKPLESLHKISLVMCEVGHALRNCSDEIQRIFPNLIEIDMDYCDDLVDLPQGICKIRHLQKLSITNCHNLRELPQGIGELTDLEMLRLHACTGLLELPDSLCSLRNLSFLDISECYGMERMPEGMGELCNLTKLDMSRCLSMRHLPRSILDLRDLRKAICDEETSILWRGLEVCLPELQITVRKETINLDWLGVDLNNYTCHF